MSQRYQKEIEEILEQANVERAEGKEGPGRGRTQESPKPKTPRQARPGRGFRLTTGKLLLAGVVLLVLSPILGTVGLMEPAAWIGIGLIIASYVIYFTRPRRLTERRWRGQLIEDEPQPNAWQRLWRWLTRG
jgi:hypothetical protein